MGLCRPSSSLVLPRAPKSGSFPVALGPACSPLPGHLLFELCLSSRMDLQQIGALAVNPLGDRIIDSFFPDG